MSTLTAGSRLGSYEILAPLGAGGMGQVFSARDTKLGRKVAIKVLEGDRHLLAQSIARFGQEARAASALNHPNIVTIYEVGFESDVPFIVMEFVDGKTLRELGATERLTIRRALQIATQVAEGLAAAHERGIVHRDLKPENVMLNKDGLVKIVDFGLAKQSESSDESQETFERESPPTRPGTVLGTVGYMSPEQANALPLDFRSDQFSFGAIVYELVTGRRAFLRATSLDTLSAIVHEDPEPIAKLNPKTPPPLRWMIERCLEKNPRERYASTIDLARELRTLSERLAETTSSGEHEIRPRLPWRRYAGFTAAGVAALILVGGGAKLLYDHAPRVTLAKAAPQRRSVAVLPFRDLTGSPQTALLGAGFAESIGARLARVDSISVVPAAASTAQTDRALARELGADVVVRGSLQRAGDQIRITFAVADPSHGSVQSDSLTGTADLLFDLQDRVADRIAAALDVRSARPSRAPVNASLSGADQDRYTQALGYLQRYEDPASVDEAISILESLDKKQNSASVAATLGRAYMSRYMLTHEPEWSAKALSATRRARSLDETSSDVLLAVGQVATRTGAYDDALDAYRRALAIKPDSADALLGYAEALDRSGHDAEAEQSYRNAIELRPSYWGGYNKLGAFHLTRGNVAKAIPMFERVRSLAPDNLRGLNNLGAAYEMQGRYRDAINVFAHSVELHPNPDGYSNLGTCRYFIHDFRGAAESYERAVALSPENFVLWANLGDACRWSKGLETRSAEAYEKSIALARRELNLNPRNGEARSVLAVSLAKTGRFEDAEHEMANARTVDPQNVIIAYQSAVVAAVRRDEKTARDRLALAVQRGYNRDEALLEPEFAAVGMTKEKGE